MTVLANAPHDAEEIIDRLGRAARGAAAVLCRATTDSKNAALCAAAAAIRERADRILAANARDVDAARANGVKGAFIDRLTLATDRVEAMARGLEEIARLDDPVGRVLDAWDRPNGLRIERVSTPLGVIGVIFESRPNVAADAGALCLKAGNAAILRGGSESFYSSREIVAGLAAGLVAAGLPEASVQLVPTTDRAAVGALLRAAQHVDVIVPRGGLGLIRRVESEAAMPVFRHLDGICHTYLHTSADAEMARAVTLNAKMRRPGICGATETVLVDRDAADRLLPGVLEDLIAAGCEVRGDPQTQAQNAAVKPVQDSDWDTEYLDSILSVKVVDNLEAALAHIARHGTNHTEAIVADDAEAAETFLNRVDAAIVMHNASTQFADGGEFGMGAEIGIATGRIHARGPVGVDQLTIYKYKVRGTGQNRH